MSVSLVFLCWKIFVHILTHMFVARWSASCLVTDLNRRCVRRRTMTSCAVKSKRNPYAAVQVDPDSDYITPGTLDLEQFFWTGTTAPYTHVNQVWPRIYIGDEKTALERLELKDLGVTHVLNAAEGKWNNVLTGANYYKDLNIQYLGVEADDKPTFNISQYFLPATEFIHEALSQPQNKVLVHCVMGRSRSATLVLAYLMVKHSLTVVEAIEHVQKKRCILPNHGFLKQLRALDITLQEDKLRQNRHMENQEGKKTT